MDPHRLAELRSVALHEAIAERLLQQPELVDAARRRLRATSERTGEAAYYREQWCLVLDEPLDRIVAFLREDSEHARALRQSTPFAGVIDARKRWRIWRTVRDVR